MYPWYPEEAPLCKRLIISVGRTSSLDTTIIAIHSQFPHSTLFLNYQLSPSNYCYYLRTLRMNYARITWPPTENYHPVTGELKLPSTASASLPHSTSRARL